MSMPHERTRAVIETRKFLDELRLRDDIPDDVKKSAAWCLRHYPSDADVTSVGYAVMQGSSPNPFGTSVDYDEHKRNIKQSKG
jgi:hypothetical protein